MKKEKFSRFLAFGFLWKAEPLSKQIHATFSCHFTWRIKTNEGLIFSRQMTSSNFPSHGQKTVIVEQLFSQLSLQSQSDKVEAKKKIRVEVWTLLESEGNIRSYPVSCHDKIPNFKGKFCYETALKEFN